MNNKLSAEDLAEKAINRLFAMIPRTRPQKEALDNSLIIAHRGAHDNKKGIIENTDAAFERAKKLGCWGLELDIHATADKQLVVNHDPTLDRLWGHPKAINALTYDELHQLAPQIPLLSEVVEKYGHSMHLFIELKAPFLEEEQLFQVLKPLEAGKDYHLISLEDEVFEPFSKFPNEAMMLVATFGKTKKFCQISLEKGYGGVLGHYLLLSKTLIHQLQSKHQKAGVGFVDSTYSLYRELNRGINWLFSNNVQGISKKS